MRIFVQSLLLEEISSNHFVGYHGTNSKFSVFNDNEPIFFVADANIARTYGEIVIKAELRLENPVVFDFDGKSTYYFIDKWYIPSELAKKIKSISDDIKARYQIPDETMEELEYHEFNQNDDLDGIIMANITDANDGPFSSNNPSTNYVVFDRSQIRMLS